MSRRPRRRAPARPTPGGAAQLVLALVVGVGVAVAGVSWLDDSRDTAYAASLDRRDVPTGDRVGEAVAALREDGVYVAPDGRSLVDEAGERRIEAAVAAQPVPAYVIVWAPDAQVGIDLLTLDDVLRRELPDEDGWVFVWEGPEEGDVVQLGARGGYSDALGSPSEFVGDPADTLVEGIATLSEDDFYAPSSDEAADEWGGVAGGSFVGLLLGGSIVGLALLVGRLVAARRGRRRLLPGGWRW